MILSPEAARPVKDAIDRRHPEWRQVGMTTREERMPERPEIAVIELDGVRHAVAAGSSNAVFGAGHLGADHMWHPADGTGAAVKGFARFLDHTEMPEIHGFIHLHRFGLWTGFGTIGPEPEARAFFAIHDDEYSTFFPVTFIRDDDPLYPWRAVRRNLPTST